MQTAANRLLIISILSLLLCCQVNNENREVIHALSVLPSGLMPTIDNNIDAVQIYSQIYETLLSLDQDFKTLKPNLCKSWDMDSVGKAFTFHLYRNVLFHDGSKMNASSLKYSIDWLIENNQKNRNLRCINSVNVIDDSTLNIILKNPRPAFIYAIASPSELPIVSAAAIKKDGLHISQNPSGSGPFKLQEWQKGKKIILEKNNAWWRGNVNLDRIIFMGFKNYNRIEESLIQNKVDIVYAIRGYSLDRMKWMGKINYAVNKSISTIFIGFNLKNNILNNKNIRKALAMSLNTNKIVNLINRGNADISNNPLPGVFFNDNSAYSSQFNPEEAKKILIQEGYAKGLTLNFYYPRNFFTRPTYVESIKTALQKVGITLNITAFDSWEDLEEAMNSDSSQVFIYGWGAEILGDAGNFLRTLFYSTSKTNFFHYNNKDVDNILDKALLEKDKSLRDEYYRETVQRIMDDIPALFLMHVKEFYAYNKEKIKSVSISPYGIICYDKIILR